MTMESDGGAARPSRPSRKTLALEGELCGGDAPAVLDALLCAVDLGLLEQRVAMYVYRYAFAPARERDAQHRASEWDGWVTIDLPTLARLFVTQPSNVQEALFRLVKAGVLARGAAPNHHRDVCFRQPGYWEQTLFDAEVARAKRARPTAGAGPKLPAYAPETPIEQRTHDRAGLALLTREGMEEYLAENGLTPEQLDHCWRVIEAFQRRIAQETFKLKWVSQLAEYVTQRHMTSAQLIACLADYKARYKPRSLWGYLRGALQNADAQTLDAPETPTPIGTTTQEEGRHAKGPRATRTASAAASARSGNDPLARFILATNAASADTRPAARAANDE